MKLSKKEKIVLGIFLSIFIIFFIINYQKPSPLGENSPTQINYIPLNPEQKEKVTSSILASEFFKDIPSKNPIALRFFYFKDGETVWQDEFYMAEGNFISPTKPGIYLVMHSKYIPNLNLENICEIIKSANKNGDFLSKTEYSKAQLLWKYKGMIKHRDCFGI